MSNIIEFPALTVLQRTHARNVLAAMANCTEIQRTALAEALARLVETMDKKDREARKWKR